MNARAQGNINMDGMPYVPAVMDLDIQPIYVLNRSDQPLLEASCANHMLNKVANSIQEGDAEVPADVESRFQPSSSTLNGGLPVEDIPSTFIPCDCTKCSSCHELEIVAKTMAEEWRAWGGVAVAIAAIRCGTLGDALHAAKALGALVQEDHFEAELLADCAMQALLQLLRTGMGISSGDMVSLQFSLRSVILACPRAAVSFVAVFADHDPLAAFFAVLSTMPLFECSSVTTHMLEAKAAPALVATLSHASPYVRSAGALAVMIDNPLLHSALLAADLGPALLRAARDTQLCSELCTPFVKLTHQINPVFHSAGFQESGSAWVASLSLLHIVKAQPSVSVQITMEGGANGLVSGLMLGGARIAGVFAEILSAVLVELKAGPHFEEFCAFCEALVAEGLPNLVPSLIKPEHPDLALNIIHIVGDVLDGLEDGFPPGCADDIVSALEIYIESDADFGAARMTKSVVCLWKLFCLHSYSRPLSTELIKKLTETLVTGNWEAYCALEIVLGVIWGDMGKASFRALDAAMSGSLVPGVMLMLKGIRESTFPLGEPPSYICNGRNQRKRGRNIASLFSVSFLQKQGRTRASSSSSSEDVITRFEKALLTRVCDSVTTEKYAICVINSGLFMEMRSWAHSSTKHSYDAIHIVCKCLLSFPRAVKMMRDEGFMTALLVELMDSPCPEGPRLFPHLLGELLDMPGSMDDLSYFWRVIKDLNVVAGDRKGLQQMILRVLLWRLIKDSPKVLLRLAGPSGMFLVIVLAMIAGHN